MVGSDVSSRRRKASDDSAGAVGRGQRASAAPQPSSGGPAQAPGAPWGGAASGKRAQSTNGSAEGEDAMADCSHDGTVLSICCHATRGSLPCRGCRPGASSSGSDDTKEQPWSGLLHAWPFSYPFCWRPSVAWTLAFLLFLVSCHRSRLWWHRIACAEYE